MGIRPQHQVVQGLLAPRLSKAPTNIDEVVFQAVMEHRKFHANDDMSLFVWATPRYTGTGLHCYPISAFDADLALRIAQGVHAQRGLPASNDWYLLFPSWDADQSHSVIQ
jgi:hypothetical protein